MCLWDESAVFNPFQGKKMFALDTQKNIKLCDVLQIVECCIRSELPKVPELAIERTEGDVFPGVCVSSCVSHPHIVTGICQEIGCNTMGNGFNWWSQIVRGRTEVKGIRGKAFDGDEHNIIGKFQVDEIKENGRRQSILHIEMTAGVLQLRVYLMIQKMSLGITRGGE